MKKNNKLIQLVISAVLMILSAAPAFSAAPKKVVALTRSVAEVWSLSGGTLDGVLEDSKDLKGAENSIIVGTKGTVSLEAVLGVNPDFVILTKDIPLHKTLKLNLDALGIKTYVVDIKSFGDYEKTMKDFTKLTGRKDLFEKNVNDVKKQIQEVIASASKISGTFYFVRTSSTKNKVMKDHFANEIFSEFGLTSIVEDNSPLDELSVEELLAKNPDFIFVTFMGDEIKAYESFKKAYESNPVWSELKAVKNNKVIFLPKDLFNFKPNARWAEAYEFVLKEISK